MAPNVTIQATDIIADIRSGMCDCDLMAKYRLSAKGLEDAFSKLIDAGLLRVEELYDQKREAEDTVTLDDTTPIKSSGNPFEPCRCAGYPKTQCSRRDLFAMGLSVGENSPPDRNIPHDYSTRRLTPWSSAGGQGPSGSPAR